MFVEDIALYNSKKVYLFLSAEQKDGTYYGTNNSENLSELFKKDVSILQADAYYLCGPAKMITDINLSTTKNHHNIRKWKRIWFYSLTLTP